MTSPQITSLAESYDVTIQIPERIYKESTVVKTGFPIRFYSYNDTVGGKFAQTNYVIEIKNSKLSWVMYYASSVLIDAEKCYNDLINVVAEDIDN